AGASAPGWAALVQPVLIEGKFMTVKSLVSPLAFAAAFALSSAAWAQITVGTQDIADADIPAVQAHCDMLSLDAGADASADLGAPADDAGAEADAAAADEGADDATALDLE